MCNTAPLLRIDFQAIKGRERSDRRRRPDIAEQLKKVKRGDAPQVTRGGGMSSVEITDSVGGVSQVGNGLPRAIRIGPTFPMYQVLQTPSFIARVHNAFHFVFLIAILRDVGGARGSHRLTRKAFAIWLYTRDVDDRMDAH